ncbi:cadherin-related family member 5 isoform X2 [Erythrolamprus reginae]|uniref:cadherin-related family member 5 isoform X2 n=1 Tax=Erythrolamprus reginae TaxID=121349 RepID=UPI00396CD0DE
MAFLRPFCSSVLFLLLSVTQVESQNAECSVNHTLVEIMENNDPGLVVTDIHTNPGVTVTIKPSTETSSPSEWFEIKDSQLILKKSVDFETVTTLQLELICWKADVQIRSIIVLVFIQNENDNEPVFKQTNITVDVPEDTKVNTIVVPLANVTATDADLDTVYYSLEGSPEAMDYFNIQGINNPQIYLRKALDYEAINFMRFTLRAMDGSADAPGTHTATATISIWIVQSDLKPPWFQPCTTIGGRIVCISLGYTGKVNLSEQMSGPLILKPGPLYAIDGDKSLNEKVIYEIAAGNDNDTFILNRDSGNITMIKPANTLKTFMLYIVASQENNPYRYSQTTVKIDVERKNDNRPFFEKAIYLGRMSEAQPAKSLIMQANTPSEPLQIFAADDDFLPDKINPDIKYKIQNSSDFRVTAEGFIQTTKILNVSSHITLLAIATDTSTLEEASTLISIDVTPLTKRSQQTVESIKNSSSTTIQTSPRSEASKPTPPGNFITSGGSVQSSTSSKIVTTKTPVISAAPDGNRQSTTPSPGNLKPSTAGISTTRSNHVSSASLSSTTVTSTLSAANISATSLTSKFSRSTPSTSTAMFSTKSIVENTTASSVNEPDSPSMSSVNEPDSPSTTTGYSVADMAALGATLGILLAIAVALLALISYKYCKLRKGHEEENSQLTESVSNTNFQDDENSNSDGNDNESPASTSASLMPKSYAEQEPKNRKTQSAPKTIQEGTDISSGKEVRSILTKDRKTEDDGYKAVWFKEDVTEAKDDDGVIDDENDREQNRLESDSAAEVFDTNPSASQSLGEAEEQEDVL